MMMIDSGSWGELVADDQIEDCRNARIVRDFLEKMFVQVTRRSFDFYEAYKSGDYPLRYDERRMMSLFISAVDKITPCHFSEHAAPRVGGILNSQVETERKTSNGSTRVDLWCYYRDIDILLEFKRSYGSPISLDKNNRIPFAWSKLIQQLHSVKQGVEEWSERYARIGVLTTFIFESNIVKPFSTESSRSIFQRGRNLLANHDAPEWCAAWIPPGESMIYEYEDNNGKKIHDNCRAVLFFVKLMKYDEGYS